MESVQLKQERDRFVAFAFASADILVELDADGQVVFADGAVLGLLFRRPEDLEGTAFIDLLHENDRERIGHVLNNLDKVHRLEHIPVTLEPKPGTEIQVELSGFRLHMNHNHVYLSLSVVRDVESNSEIFRRDLHSGLLKKDSFIADANTRIREAEEEGKDVEITLLDFPELTELLDNLPADKAAHLLGEISEYLRSRSLDGDTAGMLEDGAYSLVHDDSVSEAEIVEQLVEITRKVDPKGVGAQPKAKSLRADAGGFSEQDSANALLYTINNFAEKQGEAFSIVSLSEGYGEMLENTVEKISHFKETVESENFKIAFQPIVDIKTSIIHHYECLVRLNDSEMFDNPFHFISFGEQAGVIDGFDLAMLQKTLEVLEDAAKKGNYPNVAVNISGKSLGSDLFKDTFSKLLAQKPRLRRQVIVEITESSKIQDVESANNFVQSLRKEGNSFCLDDFGTGESSFDYLRSLQVDYIKIDGSYIRESVQSLRGRQMLRAMAGLCNSLNVTTIGEMVEDEKAARLLWDCGIKFGQGYLFGKPEVDVETLVHCSKPTPYFKGFMTARRIGDTQRQLWRQSGG